MLLGLAAGEAATFAPNGVDDDDAAAAALPPNNDAVLFGALKAIGG